MAGDESLAVPQKGVIQVSGGIAMKERAKWLRWVASDGAVSQEWGYDCGEDTLEHHYLFFALRRFSSSNHFDTKEAAIKSALEWIASEEAKLAAKRDALKGI